MSCFYFIYTHVGNSDFVGVKSWLLFSYGGEMIVCNLTPVSELQHLPKNVIMEHKTDMLDESLKWRQWSLWQLYCHAEYLQISTS